MVTNEMEKDNEKLMAIRGAESKEKWLKQWSVNYPMRRGVEGGVHGELPSLYEPFNEAPCRRRTAFNRFNVDILKPCLNDYENET